MSRGICWSLVIGAWSFVVILCASVSLWLFLDAPLRRGERLYCAMNKSIQLSEAKAGMKVSKPVVDLAGNMLLREGTELTDAWLERLKARRISTITIEDGGTRAPLNEEDKQRLVAEVDKSVNHMFEKVREHPVMKQIEDCARQHLKTRIK